VLSSAASALHRCLALATRRVHPFAAPSSAAVAAGENKASTTGTSISARKLDEDHDTFTHSTVDRSLSQAIQQVRPPPSPPRATMLEACRVLSVG
jgi:hypothetical protein